MENTIIPILKSLKINLKNVIIITFFLQILQITNRKKITYLRRYIYYIKIIIYFLEIKIIVVLINIGKYFEYNKQSNSKKNIVPYIIKMEKYIININMKFT